MITRYEGSIGKESQPFDIVFSTKPSHQEKYLAKATKHGEPSAEVLLCLLLLFLHEDIVKHGCLEMCIFRTRSP